MIETGLHAGSLPKDGTIVVAVASDGTLSRAARAIDEATDGRLSRAFATAPPAENGRLTDLAAPSGTDLDRVVALTLGKKSGTSRLDIEKAGASLSTGLTRLGVGHAVVAPIDGLDLGHSPLEVATALATGATLKSYAFRKYKRAEESDAPRRLEKLDFQGLGDGAEEAFATHRAQCAGAALARDLVSEPANVLYPETFAERCRELEALGVEVEILSPSRLEELGMRAILAVGQGSARPPYAVVMRWNGGPAGDAPLALVGKGVCFDTGGISLKPAAGMEGMKWDMGGAAAVVGAMHSIAARKAVANVVGVIGLAENMPSGTAQRPGDVIEAMSGTTIEVINTDAEGRLVLADMLWFTKEHVKPSAMIDLATLTGAIIIALGHERAGLFANDDALAAEISRAGEDVGELFWRMPLGSAYDEHIKSEIADIKNVGRDREAGATAGAVFLQRFVGDLPWAHLDIAAMAWTKRDWPLAAKGGTGFGVRALDRLVATRENP